MRSLLQPRHWPREKRITSPQSARCRSITKRFAPTYVVSVERAPRKLRSLCEDSSQTRLAPERGATVPKLASFRKNGGLTNWLDDRRESGQNRPASRLVLDFLTFAPLF